MNMSAIRAVLAAKRGIEHLGVKLSDIDVFIGRSGLSSLQVYQALGGGLLVVGKTHPRVRWNPELTPDEGMAALRAIKRINTAVPRSTRYEPPATRVR